MTRGQKLVLSAIVSVSKQIIALGCGFVLLKYIIGYYGSTINGLVSSITQFLGFIVLLEFGISPVIQSNLYPYLARHNQQSVNDIYAASVSFFRKIAYIFLGYILVLIVVYPLFVNRNFAFLYTALLVLIISINSFAQYYWGISAQILINSDQKVYISASLQAITLLLNTVISVILIMHGFSIHMVLLSTACIYLLRPLGLNYYVVHYYHVSVQKNYTKDPIKQKWNGFAQHLAAVICERSPIVFLTFFSVLSNVSVYAVYLTIIHGVSNLVMNLASGLDPLWGNMLARQEKKNLQRNFGLTEWFFHALITSLFATTGMLILPFVKIYTQHISDANYQVPLLAFGLVAAYAMKCLRIPYFRMIKAAGHYRQTQNGAFIQVGVSLILGLILIPPFQLLGAGFALFVAMFYHTCYLAWYLREHIIKWPFRYFVQYILLDTITCLGIYLSTRSILLTDISYHAWIWQAIKVFLISCCLSLLMNLVFKPKNTHEAFSLLSVYLKKISQLVVQKFRKQ